MTLVMGTLMVVTAVVCWMTSLVTVTVESDTWLTTAVTVTKDVDRLASPCALHLGIMLPLVMRGSISTEHLAYVVMVTYRMVVAVSMLLLVIVEVMKFVEVTTMVDMLVEKTVVVVA